MSSENEVEHVEYRMDGDTDIERLHNRLNPPGALGLANKAFGGQSEGYYSMEEHLGKYSSEELVDPKVIAGILSSDTDQATSALRLLDSCEEFAGHPILLDELSVELSQEDMASNSLNALKTIYSWTKKVANNIFDEMTNYELVARYLEFTAENLRVTSRDRRGTQGGNRPLKVETRIANLAIRYEPVKDIASLLMAIRVMTNVTREYYSYNGDELSKLAERIPQLMADPEQLAVAMSQVGPSKLARSNVFRPSSFNDGSYVSPHILGCHRLTIRTQESIDLMDRRFSVRLIPSDTVPRPLPPTIEFRRFPITTQDQALKMVAELAKYLQSINTLVVRQRRMSRIEKVGMVVQRLTKEIESGRFNSTHHRRVIAMVNQYNDWVANPYKELYGLVCRNLRAVINVCEINAM